MKRILFITKYLYLGGGAEKQTVDIANGLCEKGFEIAVLVFEPKGEKGIRIKDLNNKIEVIPAGSRYIGSFFVRGIYETAKAIRRWKPDALCSMVWNTKPVAAFTGRILGIKTVLVEVCSPRNELLHNPPMLRPKRFTFSYRKRIYALADVVVGVSKGVARETKEFFQLNEVKAVQNGIDIEEIIEKSEKANGVPHEYFQQDLPVLVSVGRLHVQKGYSYLLEAFRIVNETAEARLIIVGDGSLKKELRLKAESLEIDDKIALVGETEPYAYMRHSDVFVLSSLYEGLPLVLLEAISLGLPIVSTDCNYGPNEVIETGENGLLVPVADPEKLASAILKLIQDKELRLKMGERAEERAHHFSQDRMVSGYEEVFLSL